jgi:hypothetical protein
VKRAAAALAAALLAWACLRPPAQLWRDWAFVTGLFALASLFWGDRRAWPNVAAAAAAFLLAVYVRGQAPHVLAVLGLGR